MIETQQSVLTSSINLKNCYPEYGIQSEILSVNGVSTEQQIIQKNKKVVSLGLTERYTLIPNELVHKTVLDAVSHVEVDGMKPIPLKPKGSDKWYKDQGDGLFLNEDETRASFAFILPKEYDFTGEGDMGNIGFFGLSDIIGKSAVRFGSATYRLWCQNQMFHLATGGAKSHSKLIDQRIRTGYARHTTNLNLDVIAEMIQSVLLDSLNILKKYRQWHESKISKEEGISLINSMPKYVLEKCQFGSFDKKSNKYNVDTSMTKYKVFNELTRFITHDSTNYRQALLLMHSVDSILA